MCVCLYILYVVRHCLHFFLIFFLFFSKSEGTRNIIALGTIPLTTIEKFSKMVSSHFCRIPPTPPPPPPGARAFLLLCSCYMENSIWFSRLEYTYIYRLRGYIFETGLWLNFKGVFGNSFLLSFIYLFYDCVNKLLRCIF